MMEQTKDDFFLLAGKILFIASEFERDTKSLIHSLQLKANVTLFGHDSENLDLFCMELEKFQSTRVLLKQIEKPAELKKIFSLAIKGRNFVAHDLTLDIELLQDDEETLNKFLTDLILPTAQDILKAHSIVKQFIFQFNKDENVSTVSWEKTRFSWLQTLPD